MDLNATLQFDAPPTAVFAMLVDEEFLARKAEATHAVSHDSTVARDGDTAAITQKRVMPTEDLPDFVQSFVGSTLTLTQDERWAAPGPDGGRDGTMTIRISGAPVTFDGTVALAPTANGTEYRIDGRIKASVPFVGGKIERAVHGALSEAVLAEERQGRLWLAERS